MVDVGREGSVGTGDAAFRLESRDEETDPCGVWNSTETIDFVSQVDKLTYASWSTILSSL